MYNKKKLNQLCNKEINIIFSEKGYGKTFHESQQFKKLKYYKKQYKNIIDRINNDYKRYKEEFEEIKINKHSGSITFTNNGISFSQFGIAKEILDLVDNQQQEIDRLINLNKQLVEECQRLDDEETRLNNIINQADNKNLELIQKINKIYDIIENKNITGIEARLLIQDILDKEVK